MTKRTVDAEGGLTMVELLVAIAVLGIGIAGLLGMQMSALKAGAYSRHATEASVLAEDFMEELRTIPPPDLLTGAHLCPEGDPSGTPKPCTQRVNADGEQDADGDFRRLWTANQVGAIAELEVTVQWNEHGSEPHAIALRTDRNL